MGIRLDNVAIAVRDLEATIAFFTDLGLEVIGRDTVQGEWTDTAVGLDGNHAKIAMLQTPYGNARLEQAHLRARTERHPRDVRPGAEGRPMTNRGLRAMTGMLLVSGALVKNVRREARAPSSPC